MPQAVEWKTSALPVAYAEAVGEMEARVAQIRRAGAPELVWLLEHPPLYTAGASAKDSDLLSGEAFPVHRTGRGGQYTYHGPGQLVVYPIIDLKPDRKDLHRYLRDLESVLIQVACSFGVQANRDPSGTGVFTELGKLGAIGVRISSGWITSHGVALNVSTQLDFFETIVPCGIRDRGVSSLERELQCAVPMTQVKKCIVESFEQVFTC